MSNFIVTIEGIFYNEILVNIIILFYFNTICTIQINEIYCKKKQIRGDTMQYNREIAVVYTVKEALEKLNYMRSLGFFEHELHILTKNIEPFQSLKMQTEIDVHQAGNVIDKVKGMIHGTDGVKVCLRRFYLTDEEIRAYADLISNGAIFIIALHEYPMEKQKQPFKMKDFAKLPRLQNGQMPTNIRNKQEKAGQL